MYDGDGSPESPSLVPVVGLVVGFVGGFVEALVTVVLSVKPVVLASVGRFKQLQMKNNNNNNIKEEVVQKLNKPDSNYAGVMAPQ